MCRRRRVCLRQQTTATLATAGLLWPANARCKGRPFLKKKEGRALQCPQRAQFIPEQSETYIVTICRKLGHSHQIITSEHGGTETAEKTTVEAARAVHWGAVVSARSGETEDVTIVHLAVGWGVLQLKVGSFSRSERMAKWNEALRIEEALDGRARFAGAEPWRGWVAT